MTDYEKLKAFAEELIPGFFEKKIYHQYDGNNIIDNADWNTDTVKVFGDNSSFALNSLKGEDSFKQCQLDNLDKWIDETREYWRAKGLPSLQVKTPSETTSYQKVKAFAEELVPNYKKGFSGNKHNGEPVIDYTLYDYPMIRGRDSNKIGISSGISWRFDVDEWINETREYWREKGLPSLQNYHTRGGGKILLIKDMNWGHLMNTIRLFKRQGVPVERYEQEVQRRNAEKQDGKLYKMPNTVVHLKTQAEYNEYMQMCEDVGWELYGYSTTHNCFRIREEKGSQTKDYYIDLECRVLTLPELKERIGVKTIKKGIVLGVDTSALAEGEMLYFDSYNGKLITNADNTATKIMNNIKNTAKRLLLTEPEKTYVKAGLMDIDKNYSQETNNWLDESMRREHAKKAGVQKELLEVAKEIIKDKNC